MDMLAIGLFLLSIALLTVVFFIIRTQVHERYLTQEELTENKHLLQSIIDNSSNSVFVKKINGEYLFVNKPFEQLFGVKSSDVLGKTDEDFLDAQLANQNKNADFRVFKEGREIKTEEVFHQDDGLHTYLSTRFPLFDNTGRIYAVGGISTNISDRKSNEDSMREGDKFFKMSLDFLVVVGERFFLKANPAFIKFLGYSETELFETPFLSLIHPDDIESSKAELQNLATGINTVNYENRWLCKDGIYRWVSWVASPDMATGHLYAVGHDITERKKREESLKMADRFFNMSFDMLVVAKGEYFVKVNSAFTRILGYEQKDMADRPFLSFAHPDDLKQAASTINRLQKGEPVVNFKARGRTKSGEYKWLDWTSTADPKTGLIYAVARDITEQVKLENEQKRAVRQLYESEQKLKMIIENIGEGVIVANREKQVVMANYMASEILNIEKEDQLTANFADNIELYYPDERTIFPSQNLPMEKALNGEATEDVDLVLWDAQAREKKRVLMSGRPIFDQENKVVAAVVTVKDISRYKQLEAELKEAESKYRRVIGFRKEDKTTGTVEVEKPAEEKDNNTHSSE